MGSFFGGGSKSPAPVAPLPPDDGGAAAKAAAEKIKKQRFAAIGQRSTILTGGLGVSEDSNILQRKLGSYS
ncbi:MAG TPA: hypothetical protein EYQ21_05510 [Flavobacteriales bacterium]|nr:hypothetical protein [Flavobacteriales bacterium]